MAMICASIILYACGLTWLKIITKMAWGKTLAVGMMPFLLGDALKIAAAVPIVKLLRPILQSRK